MRPNSKSAVLGIFGAGVLALAAGAAFGQGQPAATPPTARTAPSTTTTTVSPTTATRLSANPQRDTLLRMMRPVTIELTDTPLSEVMKFIQSVTGADIETMWADDRNAIGLDQEHTISLKVANTSALSMLEKVLEKSATDSAGQYGNTWQISDSGSLQVGPRERLNKHKRVEIYDISDLLLILPDYMDAPEFDLNAVLGGSQGGGQSPFTQNQNRDTQERRPREDRAQDLVNILVQLVEPEQWQDNGGDGASIRYFQGSLIVNGPDYVHRALNGYPYWPQELTSVAESKGRRWVKLDGSTGTSTLDGIATSPVTAVVGGRLIRSDDPPGGTTRKPAQKKSTGNNKKK